MTYGCNSFSWYNILITPCPDIYLSFANVSTSSHISFCFTHSSCYKFCFIGVKGYCLCFLYHLSLYEVNKLFEQNNIKLSKQSNDNELDYRQEVIEWLSYSKNKKKTCKHQNCTITREWDYLIKSKVMQPTFLDK